MNRQYHYQKELKHYILFFTLAFIGFGFIKYISTGNNIAYMGVMKKYDGSIIHVVEAKAEAASITSDEVSGAGKEPAPDARKYFDLFVKYFGDDAEVMYAVAACESGLREKAYNTYNRNKTVDIGILQVNSIHWNKPGCDPETLLTAEGNIKCAKGIYETQGKTAWSCYNSEAFKKFL